MPVFIVTTPNGQRFKLISDSASSAKQTAVRRTNIPAVRLSIQNALDLGVAGSGASDDVVFDRLDIPALDRSAAETADERLTTSRGFRVEPQAQQLIDERSARIRQLERERTGELRPIRTDITVGEEAVNTGGRSESFIEAALRGSEGVRVEPSGVDVSVADPAVRQIGETTIRPSVSQNRIWNYTRPNGSTVQVVARSLDEAYDFLVRRGDFGPNDRPPIVDRGSAPPNTPLGLFSDNAGEMSRSSETGTTSTSGASGVNPPSFEEPDNLLARNPLLGETTQFRQFLRGQGVNPDLLGGRLLSRFQPEALSLFDIGTATGAFGNNGNPDANNPFQLALQGGLLQNLGSAGLNTFRNLLNAQPGDAAADIFRNASPGDTGADELRRVAALALGGRTNLGFANRFGEQIVNQIGRNYLERSDLNPQLNQTFAQALNQGLRLGG